MESKKQKLYSLHTPNSPDFERDQSFLLDCIASKKILALDLVVIHKQFIY